MSGAKNKFQNVSWLQNTQQLISHLTLRSHFLISALFRLLLISYSQIHDAKSPVQYTDIDYKVVTDGARLVLTGNTPFARHTYRYSPILAYMQIPNIVLHPAYGKVIYAMFDLLIGVVINSLVRLELETQYQREVKCAQIKWNKSIQKSTNSQDERNQIAKLARIAACFWLYNPLTPVISTRGNGDSFTSFFVILSLYLLIRVEYYRSKFLIFSAGLSHGFVIHLRLYPIVFSLAYYLCLSTGIVRRPRDIFQIMSPNKQQICLMLGTFVGLASVTWTFYTLYGWQYIYEAYFYHFMRKDVRHNFSLQFLLQYLSSADGVEESNIYVKFLIVSPQLLLIFYLSFSFGRFRQTLSFCVFSLAFVVVTYNSVVTSQYFIWHLAVLPVCLKNLQGMSLARCSLLLLLWLSGQALWLLPAYLFEFKTWQTFYWIGLQSSAFFIINSYILAQLIKSYGNKSLTIK